MVSNLVCSASRLAFTRSDQPVGREGRRKFEEKKYDRGH
ncbi:hypothetical protein SAMN04488128_1011161 [Chitinophaga eiseniae]|uniref:Uncharacterized protein n=1 Tax=Chitinophaga eiseniae TaxID=634771 RepID=A0A1T4MLZ0_9BACT|nr:hypothetical protein SAMN04488128_1011161 [Chitinophaga eiseniae]